MQPIAKIREFKLGKLHLIVDALPDWEPDLSWDETGEVRAKLESGEFVCFVARARLFYDGVKLADDYLGGCIYADPAEFQDHRQCGAETRRLRESGSTAVCGSYFSDMVRGVCHAGRAKLRKLQGVKVRPCS